MKYRALGNTGIEISTIGLGCSGFWGDKRFGESKAIDIVHTAFENGVNFFDTGSNYSNFNAEPRLGKALEILFKTEPRDKVVVSTKAGSNIGYAPTVADNDLSHADFSPESIEKSCINSIQNLKCDYIDVFQLHGLDKSAITDELLKKLLSLKSRGLIRSIGVNTHFSDEMKFISERAEVFDMVLMDCNLLQLNRFADIDLLKRSGIASVVGTVLAQGHLVTKKIGSLRNGSFFWYLARSLIKPSTRDFARHAGPVRRALASIEEMSPAQAAFAYLLRNPDISGCLFGTTNPENLLEVIAASDLELSEESVAKIDAATAGVQILGR